MRAGSGRDAYPFWAAMGAALVGTLLGGGAVWLGVSDRLETVARTTTPAASPVEVTEAVEPEQPRDPPTEELSVQEGEGLSTGAVDPGDSPLVRAIEQTRDSVVSIELNGAVAGSGVVYDASGTLLTNYHVIEPILRAQLVLGAPDAASITVRFVDGRERSATVLAADPDEDVAILSLVGERAEERFHAAPLGYSASLRLGEQVFAIGSPVGFEGTVATGIISSLQRTGVLANRSLPVLQLDAAINFGNSGGPLFNLAGEIVGITTARSKRGEGIGFAIPIDRIRLFLRALERGMRGRSGVIGVELGPSRELAARIGALGYHSGITVTGVEEGRAAARGGMKTGDVIVSVRGLRHDELDSSPRGQSAFSHLLGDTIRSLLPGEILVVEVVRDGALHEVEIVVEAASVEGQARIDAEVLLGLDLVVEGDEARIRQLIPSSPIARMRGAGVLRGARITGLFGQPVANLEQLGERLALLRSWSTGGGRRSIAITFETADGHSLRANSFPLADP